MAGLYDDDTSATHDKRDVSNSYILLNPAETPFVTMAPKGRKPKQSIIEWPVRKLGDPQNVAVADGVDYDKDADSTNNEANKKMLYGRLQKIRRGTNIGDIAQEANEQYGGITDLYADNIEEMVTLTKQDMELTCLSLADSAQTIVSGKPKPATRGFGKWLGVGGATADAQCPIDATVATPAGSLKDRATASAVTEDDIRAVMASIWTARRRNGNFKAFVTANMKMRMSDFGKTGDTTSTTVPLRRFNASQDDKTISLDVQFYEGDFGKLALIPHPFLPKRVDGVTDKVHMYLVDMDFVEINMVRNPRHVKLEDRGGGPNGFVDAIFVNSVLNPQAHGCIYTSVA